MAKRWIPSDIVRQYVVEYGADIRGITTEELWNKSTFYLRKKLFGMAGITFHQNRVVFNKEEIAKLSVKQQAGLIYHELVHVAQQLTLPQGWTGFMFTYSWEWVRAGFSYQKMKKFGLEKEALDMEKDFRRQIYHIWLPGA